MLRAMTVRKGHETHVKAGVRTAHRYVSGRGTSSRSVLRCVRLALVHFLLKGGKAGGHELILAGTESG